MQSHGIEFIVLINNRPIFEYTHENLTYIEGRQGSNYEIELHNRTHNRVQTVLSVDGLSVIDGKEAGSQSQGYVIDPYSSVRVPGWLLNAGSAAKFAFAGRHDSYATQMSDGKSRNNGVIGVLVYSEKLRPPINNTWNGSPYPLYPFYQTMNSNIAPDAFQSPRGIAGSVNTSSMSGASIIGSSFTNNALPSGAPSAAQTIPVNQTLGTAFGDQTQFATRMVAFDRGDQLTIMSLFYDNMKGLRARGVPIERRQKIQRPPEAFPGMPGCQPPVGWKR